MHSNKRMLAVMGFCLLGAACSSGGSATGASTSSGPVLPNESVDVNIVKRADAAITTTTTSPVDTELQIRTSGVPAERIDEMEDCGNGKFCFGLEVDDGYIIRYKIIKSQAEEPKGLLALHFGGPGTNAYEFIDEFMGRDDTVDRFLGSYDILGVEQRGTSSLDGVDCGNDDIFHAISQGVLPEAERIRQHRTWISECPVGEFGSLTAADDIASVLEYLNADRSVFLGYSYGGVIGSLMASNHSDVVDAVILDSPAVDYNDERAGIEQIASFQNSLDSFFARCDAREGACVSSPDGGAETDFFHLVRNYDKPGDLAFASALLLYNEETQSLLDTVLEGAYRGDESQVASVADQYHGRSGSSYPPSSEIFALVGCVDGSDSGEFDYDNLRREVLGIGVFGELMIKGGVINAYGLCEYWGGPNKPFTIDNSESDVPIMIVASTNDPAASWAYTRPYIEEKLASDASVVLIHRVAHSLWGTGDSCINSAVNKFIESSEMPAPNSEEGYYFCEEPFNARS